MVLRECAAAQRSARILRGVVDVGSNTQNVLLSISVAVQAWVIDLEVSLSHAFHGLRQTQRRNIAKRCLYLWRA